jgi:hypothetical protein
MKLTEAQIARVRELETVRGEITPGAVVEDAKDKTSPLHSLFEWNKAKAAEAHWLTVAREVIGSVTLLVTTTEHQIKAPHYVRDPDANGQGYRSVTALRGDPDSAREALIYTLQVAAGHLRRAQDIAAPLGMQAEIDHLLMEIVGVQRALTQKAA